MKKLLLICFLGLCTIGSSAAEEVWSEGIALDCTLIGETFELQVSDELPYSARWADGSNRICRVTAQSVSFAEATIFSESEDGVEGYFCWDYLTDKSDDFPLDEIYTLSHIIENGDETLDTKTITVTLVPEPLAGLLALAVFALLFRKRKILSLTLFAAVFALSVRADVLESVAIRSRTPWEGKVDIDYVVAGGADDQEYTVAFYGKEGDGEAFALTTLSGDGADGTVAGNGTFRATWDAAADFPEGKFEDLKVMVSLEEKSDPGQGDNTVYVVYEGDSATVAIADNITNYVSAAISGAHVTLTQSAKVGTNTCGEISYFLSGSSDDGEFSISGAFKSTFTITDLSLNNPSGAAVNIANGKRINLNVEGTNTFSDCSNGKQKACFIIKGHAEVKGSGTIYATGNTKHALKCGEYLELKKTFTGSIIVNNALGDGLHIGQYFDMKNGSVTVLSAGDDCVQVEANEEDEEYDGQMFLRGGKLTLNVTAIDVKGLKCDDAMTVSDDLGNATTVKIVCSSTATAAKGMKSGGDMTISGGTFEISTAGKGMWDESNTNDLSTTACAAIKCGGDLKIYGGDFTLAATGSGGKGINVDGNLIVTNCNMTISTTGGLYYNDGTTENTNYTGDTERIDDAYTSSPKGIKVDGNVDILGGTISVTTTGRNGEGIESKKVMTIEGGTLNVSTYDDCLNSAGDMYIKGGTVTVVAKNNDGIDSNGDLYIEGGTVIACGASDPECGLDAAERYALYITGGTVLGLGGGNNSVTATTGSQAVIDVSGSVTAGSTLTVKSGNTELYTFSVPSNYAGNSGGGGPGGGWGGGRRSNALISLPELTSGSSYTVYCGSSSIGTATASTSYRGR